MLSRTLRNLAITIVGALVLSAPAFALRINVPRLHLKTQLNYVSQDYGPLVYYQDTNTLAIAGHRVTHTHPFYDIDKLQIGDRVYVRYKRFINVYRVTHIYLHIKPSHVRYFVRFPGLVLSACTPKHFATYRYVVRGRLVNVLKN